MAVTGWKNPGTTANAARAGSDDIWADPGNVVSSNNAYAEFDVGDNSYSDWLRVTNFGFTTGDIPSGSTIDGIEVQYEVDGETTQIKDSQLFVRKSSGQVGTSQHSTSAWTTTEHYETRGGATNLWGTTWADTDIVGVSTFGFDLSGQKQGTAGTNRWGRVDHFQCRIHYTEGSSTQNITGALFTNTQSFPAATVAPGAVTITGALLTDGETFPAATVSATYSISGALVTNSQSFPAATVTPGAVSVSGSLLTNSQTFPAATLTTSYGITGALVTNGQTFPAATLSASYGITGALLTDGETFPAATLTPGAVGITGALVTNSQTFPAATVSQGGGTQEITAALYSNAQSFPAAVVSTSYGVSGALVTNSQSFPAATVGTAYGISGALVTNSQSFPAGTVGASYAITGALITNSQAFPAGSVAAAYNVPGDLLTNEQSFPAGTVTAPGSTQNVTGALYTNEQAFPAATVDVASLPVAPSGGGGGGGSVFWIDRDKLRAYERKLERLKRKLRKKKKVEPEVIEQAEEILAELGGLFADAPEFIAPRAPVQGRQADYGQIAAMHAAIRAVMQEIDDEEALVALLMAA